MLKKVYQLMYKAYGPQGWWPLSKGDIETKHHVGRPVSSEDRFEIMVGAILTQNTSWKNVEKAIASLNKQKALYVKAISGIKKDKLANLIKSSGYHNQKAERLIMLAQFFQKNNILKFLNQPTLKLRQSLLDLKGIGPETADSIILYAAEKPSFVIDAYTRRIFSRLGLCDHSISYEDLQSKFMNKLPHDTGLFKEYHALIVEHAKQHCRTKPICDQCPLKRLCKFN